MEAALAKRTLDKSEHEMETIADVMKEIKPLQNAFPTLAHSTYNFCKFSFMRKVFFSSKTYQIIPLINND